MLDPVEVTKLSQKQQTNGMAKDRIDLNEMAYKIVATAGESDGPLWAMAELLADFVMEAEVTQKIGAAPHERRAKRKGYRNEHRERRRDTRPGTLTLQVRVAEINKPNRA